ncbi:MAG: DUF5685 family protein [Christensenellales bacterium]|jgi:hypothetical protein
MFGYLRPWAAELKVWEAQLYRAAYCGICRAMGRQTGQLSRLALQYDAATLALAWLADEKEPGRMEKRCILHPFHRHPELPPSPAIQAAADVCALLAWYKCCDARLDRESLRASAGALFLRPAVRRLNRNPDTASLLRRNMELLDEMHRLEKESCSEIDRMAELSGELLAAAVTAWPPLTGKDTEAWDWLGRQLGRWLYLTDALADREKDREKGRYNVLLLQNSEPTEVVETARQAALWAAGQASDAWDLLPHRGLSAGIIENVLKITLPKALERAVALRPLFVKGSIDEPV